MLIRVARTVSCHVSHVVASNLLYYVMLASDPTPYTLHDDWAWPPFFLSSLFIHRSSYVKVRSPLYRAYRVICVTRGGEEHKNMRVQACDVDHCWKGPGFSSRVSWVRY